MSRLPEKELFAVERFIKFLSSQVEDSEAEMILNAAEYDKANIVTDIEYTTKREEKKPLWQAFQQIASDVPDEVWDKIPSDSSENLDKYLYGGASQ